MMNFQISKTLKHFSIMMALTFGAFGSAGATCNSPIVAASDGSCQAKSKPTVIYLVSETQFQFQTALTGTFWYIVDISDVGATNFDRIHADFATGLVKGCDIWF